MTAIAFLCALLLAACSDPVERYIDTLVKGGRDADQAKLELFQPSEQSAASA